MVPIMMDHFDRLLKCAAFLIALVVVWGFSGQGLAQNGQTADEGPLTQADLDAYVYLLPKMAEVKGGTPEEMAIVLRESGLTRRRAAYVVTKVFLAQSLAQGLSSPDQMIEENVPLYLRPSTEEITLVNNNLTSLFQAQSAARRAAGQPPQ